MGGGPSRLSETVAKCDIELNIWYPQKGCVGHISLLVDKSFYVSFWPEDEVSAELSNLMRTVPSGPNTFRGDIQAEGRKPDKVIPITLELDKLSMRKCWNEIKHDRYSFSFNNCAGAVESVLAAGNDAFLLSLKDFPRRRKPRHEWNNTDYCTWVKFKSKISLTNALQILYKVIRDQ